MNEAEDQKKVDELTRLWRGVVHQGMYCSRNSYGRTGAEQELWDHLSQDLSEWGVKLCVDGAIMENETRRGAAVMKNIKKFFV